MATQDDNPMRPLSVGSTESRKNSECNEAAQVSAENNAAAVPIERRAEVRMKHRQSCSYEVFEAIEEESVIIRQGGAFALNQSKEGMLLLMGQALFDKQLFEVQTLHSGSDRVVNVFEARWAKPVPVESLGKLYLIGCKRIFGPLPVSTVQQDIE